MPPLSRHKRVWSWVWILAACAAVSARAQSAQSTPTVRSDAAALVAVQVGDTSLIRRSVALDQLRHASRSLREEAAMHFARTLADTSPVRRNRALAGLRVLGEDGFPAVVALDRIAGNPRDALRIQAIAALGAIGPAASSSLPTIRRALTATGVFVRLQAAASLLAFGDTSAAKAVYQNALQTDDDRDARLIAARALADLSDTAAVPALRGMLADTTFRRQIGAATALGLLGPKAVSAVPQLTAMLSDTAPRRIAQGQASEFESPAAFAAWALARIVPFRSVAANTVLEPLYARVADSLFSLRSDGLGVYAWGVDSVAVWMGSGFFLHMSPLTEGRGPIGPVREGPRRALVFDLSTPIAGTGAQPLGVIRDNEAYIWVWYRRDSSTDRVTTVREISVSDAWHSVERIEMHFRVAGVLHVLQMGPFVEGQGGAGPWYTGMNGVGTSLGQLAHPTSATWIVQAPSGSIARLWSFEDRTRPIDRGLYRFSLYIRFASIPSGPIGGCVPSLRCW